MYLALWGSYFVSLPCFCHCSAELELRTGHFPGTRAVELAAHKLTAVKELHSNFWISSKAVGVLRQSLPQLLLGQDFNLKTSNHTAKFFSRFVENQHIWQSSSARNSHHNWCKHNINPINRNINPININKLPKYKYKPHKYK